MIAVVSHDSGGAELLSSYVRRQSESCMFVLDGPARVIFSRKIPGIACAELRDAAMRADWLLCGTSWQSDLELQAIPEFKVRRKRTVAFLDHWINYNERFQRGARQTLPDEIWVGDDIGGSLAKRAFPDIPVRVIENPYFKDLRDEFARIPLAKSSHVAKSVVYVCEPIRQHALLAHGDPRHWGYTEEEALRYFLTNLYALGGQIGQIVIRPHPSEPADKYDWALGDSQLSLKRGGDRSLVEEIAESDIVAGCDTMAMVVGLVAGKRVICTIPPGGRPLSLPHAEIELLSNAVAETERH